MQSSLQVQGHVDDALAKGAKALTGGKKADLQAPYDKGYFFSPTVLSDCTIDMKVWSRPPFLPQFLARVLSTNVWREHRLTENIIYLRRKMHDTPFATIYHGKPRMTVTKEENAHK